MNGVQTFYLTQGVLGITVLVLGIVFAYYYKTSQKKIDDLNKIIFQLQVDRLNDSKETTKEVTAVVQDNAQSLRILSEKIEVGKSIERNRR